MPQPIKEQDLDQLYKGMLAAAHEAMKNAYCPYSQFPVGAALLSDDGVIYTGCNLENSNFAQTICAERTAFAKALCEGKKKFRAIAVVSAKSFDCWPCGLCRQFMSEFGDLTVVVNDADGKIKTLKLADLLPS